MLLRRCTAIFSGAVRSPVIAPSTQIRFSSSSRGFSEAAVHAATADNSEDSADKSSGVDYVMRHKSAVGREYHELLHRSRGANRLALGDFKNLCVKISDPKDVKYAKYAAELFQRKGQDFSEETNSHFVMACIRGNAPGVVVEHFSDSKHRLGAWTTNKSFNRLLEALHEQDVLPEQFVDVLKTLKVKGLYLNDASVELLQKLSDKHEDEQLKELVHSVAAEVTGAP